MELLVMKKNEHQNKILENMRRLIFLWGSNYFRLDFYFLFFFSVLPAMTYAETGDLKIRIWEEKDVYNNYYTVYSAPGTEIKSVDILSVQGENPAAAIMLRNESNTGCFLKIEFIEIPGYRTFDPSHMIIREAVHIRTYRGSLVADALPQINIDGVISVPSNETRQLYLDFDTHNLTSGLYATLLCVKTISGENIKNIPIKLEVKSVKLPFSHPLKIHTWDGSLKGMREGNWERVYNTLSQNYVNVFHVIEKAPAKCDENGNLISAPDFTDLDNAIGKLKPKSRLLLLRCFQPAYAIQTNDHKEIDIGTEKGNRAYSQWVNYLLKHMRELGFDCNEWAAYPYDENLDNRFFLAASAIRAVNKEIDIFANPSGNTKIEEINKCVSAGLIDYICPVIKRFKQQNDVEPTCIMLSNLVKERWFYNCPNVQKHLQPTEFYRKMAWMAWSNGAVGLGYWTSTGSNLSGDLYGRSPWNEFEYGVIGSAETIYQEYDDESIIPSRRWKAFQTGLQDYLYFDLLKQQISSKHILPQNTQLADSLLLKILSVYSSNFNWQAISELKKQIIVVLTTNEE